MDVAVAAQAAARRYIETVLVEIADVMWQTSAPAQQVTE